jgi:hypothetical protein
VPLHSPHFQRSSTAETLEAHIDVQDRLPPHLRPPPADKENTVSQVVPFDTSLPDSPPLSSPAQDLIFPINLFEQGRSGSCSTNRRLPLTPKVAPSEVATDDYTLLTSHSEATVLDDSLDPHTTSSSRPVKRTSIEVHINKAKETSRAYQMLLKHKNLSHHSQSWKLFRLLYSFWRETGHVKIPSHHLSTLLKSDSDAEPIDFLLVSSSNSSSHVIDDAIQRCFPVTWTDSRYYVDFTLMIDLISTTSSSSSSLPHLLKRRASTLMG